MKHMIWKIWISGSYVIGGAEDEEALQEVGWIEINIYIYRSGGAGEMAKIRVDIIMLGFGMIHICKVQSIDHRSL